LPPNPLIWVSAVSDGSFEMKKTVLLLLATGLVLAGCQAPADAEKYDPEKYIRNHEPKTGRSD
jgi:hypothetical protein